MRAVRRAKGPRIVYGTGDEALVQLEKTRRMVIGWSEKGTCTLVPAERGREGEDRLRRWHEKEQGRIDS